MVAMPYACQPHTYPEVRHTDHQEGPCRAIAEELGSGRALYAANRVWHETCPREGGGMTRW